MKPLAETNANLAFSDALLRALVAAGARDLCVCPGSRSAPLAAASVEVAGLRRFVHIDERSAGFFALGLARARRAPVILLCTSGTAALEFAPAVAEAALSRVPLVVLTADRPPELRDWGAPQTLDQVGLYGGHVRWFAEAPVPAASAPHTGLARALGARAVHEATTAGLPGPVHLNLPFREPLAPTTEAMAHASEAPVPVLRSVGAELRPEAGEALARWAAGRRRGVVVAGPQDAPTRLAEAVAGFARRLGWPVLAECPSQLRFGPHVDGAPVLAFGDALLSCPSFAEGHAPDAVLRLGAAPTSKAIGAWLARHREASVAALDLAGGSRDPQHRVDLWLHGDPLAVLGQATRSLPEAAGSEPGWLAAFLDAEKRAGDALEVRLREAPLLGAVVARRLVEALPADATLVLSNSLAVREADGFALPRARPLRVLANRGANGIDGMLSTALGAAASGEGPVALLVGDLAFLHDVGALVAARRLGLQCTVVVLNDDGGGIFDRLPIAGEGERVAFEELFRVSHGLDLGALVEGFGCGHRRAADLAGLDAALEAALQPASGLQVIEVPIEPAATLAFAEGARRAVAEALA